MPKINVSSKAVEDSKGSGFKPIDAGEYEATIYAVEEIEHFSKKPESPYYNTPAYNIQWKIVGPKFANRRLFTRLALRPTWEKGTSNFLFFHLANAVGVDIPKDGGDIDYPEADDLLGQPVNIVVKVKQDKYAWEKAGSPAGKEGDFLTNEVSAIKPPEELDDAADEFEADESGFDL